MSESIEIGEDVTGLVGRTIIKAHREPKSKEPWPMYDQTLTLTLDDGTVWEFTGEGYDSSRLVIEKQDAEPPK